MPDLPISSAASLTGSTVSSGDLFPVLDISAASGSKGSNITLAELFTGRTLAGANIFSANGAASTPALKLTGNIFAGGSATTTLPLLYYTNGGTANFNTNGTMLGMTMPSGFTGDAIRINYFSGANMLTVDQNGSINCNFNIAANGSISTTNALFGNAIGAGSTGITLNTTNTISWSSTGSWFGAPDVYLSRKAAASLGLGLASATPIAQTLGGANGSGTNITGGTLNIGTQGTGTGAGGVINFQSHAAGGSGSTLGTLVNVLSIPSSTLVTVASGAALRLGNAATTGLVPATVAGLLTKSITLQDSTGATITLYGS